MPDCFPRCINQHSGTGETHYLFHPFSHGRFVAVYAALLACFLFLPKRAAVQPGMRIAKQLFALGAKGLGVAPAYSATKRFQNTYIDALEQLACMQKLNICFTDIRPGFVSTDLLNDGKRYPLLMQPEKVARQIVRALHHRKRVAVIDWRYAVIVFFWRMIPRWIWKRLPIRTGKTM